jgi:hypothetical protein
MRLLILIEPPLVAALEAFAGRRVVRFVWYCQLLCRFLCCFAALTSGETSILPTAHRPASTSLTSCVARRMRVITYDCLACC